MTEAVDMDDDAPKQETQTDRQDGQTQHTVFQIYEGSGEWFDLSKKPIERTSFTFGGSEKITEGYFITDSCIGCGNCVSVCPQNCIRQDQVPFQIEQDHCLYCGNCMNACPVEAVARR